MTDEIPLPPLTDEQCVELAREAGLDWHQGFPVGGEEENRYAVMCRAAVMLDRQQRAAPRVHLPHVESALRAILAVAEEDSNPTICLIADTARIALRHTPTPPAPSAEPVNLNDPAVQKRLAAQWGYVSAPSAAPPPAAPTGEEEVTRLVRWLTAPLAKGAK